MEEKDYSLDALDLKMGEDFFHDSQKISLREEVLEDNNNITDGAMQVNINNWSHKTELKTSILAELFWVNINMT